MFLERTGLTPAGSRAGVNPEGISLLGNYYNREGDSRSCNNELPARPAQVKTQLKGMLPKTNGAT